MLSKLRTNLESFRQDDRGTAVVEYALVSTVLFLTTYGAMSAVNAGAATQLVGTQSSLTCTSVYAAPGTTASLDANSGTLTCTAATAAPSAAPSPVPTLSPLLPSPSPSPSAAATI